ncbi:MAG: hypothetical protein QXY79_01290 [Candidatus Methanomethylicia archaeon]
MRGVSSNAVFIFITITLLVFISSLIFWRWLNIQNILANEMSCKNKQINYCIALSNREDVKWEEMNPKSGCEILGFIKPTEQECKNLLNSGV